MKKVYTNSIFTLKELEKQQFEEALKVTKDFCEILKISLINEKNFNYLKFYNIKYKHFSSSSQITKKNFVEDIKDFVTHKKLKEFKKIKKEILIKEFFEDFGYNKNGLAYFDYYYNLEKIIKITYHDLKKMA